MRLLIVVREAYVAAANLLAGEAPTGNTTADTFTVNLTQLGSSTVTYARVASWEMTVEQADYLRSRFTASGLDATILGSADKAFSPKVNDRAWLFDEAWSYEEALTALGLVRRLQLLPSA